MEWNLTISFLSGILGSVLVQTYIKGGINSFYNKKLESFKSDLIIETEAKKFEFNKKIHDFSIYSSKRYEIYPDLYSQVRDINLNFLILRERSYISISNVNSIESIVEYYELTGLPISEKQRRKVNKVLEKEYENQEERLEEIRNSIYQYIILLEMEKIRSLIDFKNKVELYFSKDISKITESLVSHMLELIVLEFDAIMETGNWGTTENSIVLSEIEKLKNQLKLEMSLSEYHQ